MKGLGTQLLLVPALVLVAFFGRTLPASADLVDDWLAHKVTGLEPAITYDGKPFELKFSHPAPPASIVPPVWQQTFDWLEQATNGKLTFKQFGAGQLVGIRDGFKGVGAGISNYGTCYVAFEGRGFEMSRVFAQPFVPSGRGLVDTRIYMELAEKYFVPEFERQEVHFGYSAHLGASDIMSKKPIRSLDDLKGLKVIAQGVGPEVAKAFGFVTLNIPFPEIYTSVQQGIADAVIWVDAGFVPFKIYELAKYHTTLGLTSTSIDTCINQSTFEKLPPDLKDTFYGFQQAAVATIVQRTGLDFHQKALGIYKENGVELIQLSDEEKKRWRAAAKPVVEEWIAARESDGKPGRQLIDDIERLKAKYADVSDEGMLRMIMREPVSGLVKY